MEKSHHTSNLCIYLSLPKNNQAQTTNNPIMDIGNKQIQGIGNNYDMVREHKISYPKQVLLV
jgi:hypothetical protein